MTKLVFDVEAPTIGIAYEEAKARLMDYAESHIVQLDHGHPCAERSHTWRVKALVK